MKTTKNIFEDIIVKGMLAGKVPARTDDARKWYRDTAKAIRNVNSEKLMRSDQDRLKTSVSVGNMFLFEYDPKLKEKLPYYDSLPLIFPVKVMKDHFYGINLHYLSPFLRAKLMDGLYELKSNSRYDETTRIYMGYKLLKAATKLRYFKPCLKMYLYSHVRSKFMYINPSEWDIALFLPLAKFNKASNSKVWADSENLIQ